jgi:tRNA pseudouridine38-40 synthase
MKNFKLTIEYDGTGYHGWQRQADRPTIQSEIEAALAKMIRSAVTLIGSGRTDAGVHALGQVANFRSDTELEPEVILKGLNGLLPPDIAVRDCRLAPENFHARFDATSKVYRYQILNRDTRAAVGRNYAWYIHQPLDVEAMRLAASTLVGRHDFKAFESTGSPRAHTVRHVLVVDWSWQSELGLLGFQIEANGFLRGMVRNMVGTLVRVGLGKLDRAGMEGILASRDRRCAGATAPSRGLCLLAVKY